MLCRLIAAAALLLGTALPPCALASITPVKQTDEPLATAAARMQVKDFAGARQAALKSGNQAARPFLVGIACVRLELWEEAASQLAIAADSYPLLADYALYNQGVALSKLGRQNQALPPLYRLLKQYPESRLARAALLLYADTLAAGGYQQEAAQSYATFIERYPSGGDSISALFASALCREKLGDPAAAALILRGIWLNSPASPVAARAALELNRLAAAGVKSAPYTSAELFKRGSTLYDLGRMAQAAKALEDLPHAGESEEFTGKLRLKTGQALYKGKRYQDAQTVFRELAGRGGKLGDEASYWLALALDKGGSQDEAYDLFLKLAETSKGGAVGADALREAAYLKRFQKKWSESIQLFKRFLAVRPDQQQNAGVLWEIAWVSYQSRDYQGAANYLRRVADNEELREKALYWLGKALAASGDVKGAEAQYGRLAAEYPFGYYALILNRWCRPADMPLPPKILAGSLPMPAGFEREKALIALGMFDEAARELARPRKTKNPQGIARLYLEMGNYNGAQHTLAMDKTKRLEKEGATVWGANYPLAFSEEVSKNAALNGISESLVYAIMRTESNYLPVALSPVGAVGLMQIMPATAEKMSKGDSARLTRPDLNIRLGARHLKDLLVAYDKNLPYAIAAYNAGSGNVNRWQKKFAALPQDEFIESIPFRETREYVKKVLSTMELYQRMYRLPAAKN